MKQFLHSGFVRLAIVVVMAYVIVSLCGLREHVSILSGVDESGTMHLVFGLIYILSYAASLVLAPALFLAAIIETTLSKVNVLSRKGQEGRRLGCSELRERQRLRAPEHAP